MTKPSTPSNDLNIENYQLLLETLAVENNELSQRNNDLIIRNEQFNTALNHMSQGLSMFDGEKRLIVCNARYASLYDLPPELTKSGTHADDIVNYRIAKGVFSAAAHEKYYHKCMAAVERQERYTTVEKLTNGRFIEITYVPMAFNGWLSTHEDITERRATVKAMQESQEALSIAFRASPVAMAISTPEDGALIEVNEAWITMLGYSRQEALEGSAQSLGIWHDWEARKHFVHRITEEGVVRGFDTKYCTKDGRLVDVLVSGEPAEINGMTRLLVASHDITNRNQTERELIAHRDHLQEMVDAATVELKEKAEELEIALGKERELNELQRQFVSMASHEFRTPLAIIDGAAQRLIKLTGKNRLTPEDAIERYGKIRASVQRMTALMESTLTAARIEEGKINVEIGRCDIAKVVIDVCLRQQEIAKNHVISYQLTDIPEFIEADSGALEQVLTNLLTNAEKYAPSAPEIDVQAFTEADDVIISVRDHGFGIDEDDLERIGERFFRAKTSTGISGTGIGLNLSMKLLEMHGGCLQVESQENLGSTFFIRIPIAGPQRSDQAKTQVA